MAKHAIQIQRDEHNSELNAKKISLVSGATIFAIVNTAAAGQSSIVLDDSVSKIGFATVHQGDDPWNVAVKGNVTLSGPLPAGTNAIGKLAANSGVDIGDVDVTSNTAWADPNTYIGLATVDIGASNSIAVAGNVTVEQGNDPWNVAVKGNVTLSGPLPAGTNTVGKLAANSGVDIGDVDVTSNVAWSDPKTFIGLATVTIGAGGAGDGAIQDGADSVIEASVTSTATGNPLNIAILDRDGHVADVNPDGSLDITVASSLPAGDNNIGNIDVVTNTAWSDPNTYVGLATVDIGANNSVAIQGNVTLSDAKTYIGLTTTTIGAGTAVIGKLAANSGVDIGDVDVTSNTAWSDPNTYIGLVTATHAPVSTATIITQIISATGNTTLFVAPASKYFVIKDLIVGSLGAGEVKFMEEGTDMIEYISLATQGGYSHHFGVEGMRAGTVQKSFVAALNGAATMSVHANVRFED